MKSPKTTLEQWWLLQAVVDKDGFAQAAEHVHRSQSSVSYAVGKLQELLDLPLLEIKGRKSQLTPAGELLLKRSRQLVKDALALEALAKNLTVGWESELNLVVDRAFPTDVLVKVLKEFAPMSQGCRVQVEEVVLSGAEDALAAGTADLVIAFRVPPGFLGDAIIATEFVAVAHPDHPLHQRNRTLTMEDLIRETQVVIRDSGVKRIDHGWLGAPQRWTVTSVETAVTTISNGLGFGWLPCHLIENRIKTGELKPLALREGQRREGYLYLIFGKSNVGPATRQLADLFKQHSSTT